MQGVEPLDHLAGESSLSCYFMNIVPGLWASNIYEGDIPDPGIPDTAIKSRWELAV